MEKWFVMRKGAPFQEIAEKFQIHPILARLIRNRDVIGDEAIQLYLNGTIADLYDGMLMKDMDKAVDILLEKIREDKKIRIIGDYDIDGINSTYILLEGIKYLGGEADIDIPDRMKDGYGLNRNLIDRAFDDDIDTIITCDNGIAAREEIAYGKSLGMTIIVTDHHEIPDCAVSNSGRGVGLFVFLEPCNPNNLSYGLAYSGVHRAISLKLNELIEKAQFTANVELDKAVHETNRVARLPGTYNTLSLIHI